MYSKYEQKLINLYRTRFPWICEDRVNDNINSKIRYSRPPTVSDFKAGYGARHYADFDFLECISDKGSIKKRIKGSDGLIYTRG